MSGHGHVIPRPDGAKARCGGPALCSVCAAELARAHGKETAASALLSLAAEFDREECETSDEADAHAARGDDDAGCMASGARDAWRAAARMARLRARSGPAAPSTTPPAQEDPDLTLVGLSPAQAYMAGVKAERERCALLAEAHEARYDLTKVCGCGRIRAGRACTVVLKGGLPFADLIRQAPGDD